MPDYNFPWPPDGWDPLIEDPLATPSYADAADIGGLPQPETQIPLELTLPSEGDLPIEWLLPARSMDAQLEAPPLDQQPQQFTVPQIPTSDAVFGQGSTPTPSGHSFVGDAYGNLTAPEAGAFQGFTDFVAPLVKAPQNFATPDGVKTLGEMNDNEISARLAEMRNSPDPVERFQAREMDEKYAQAQKAEMDRLVANKMADEKAKDDAVLAHRQERMNAADEAEARVNQQVQEMDADGGYFKNMSGVGKFLTLFSVAAGAIGARNSGGGPNLALQQINQDIERAVGVAKYKVAEGRAGVSRLRAMAKDEYEFEMGLRIAGNKQAQQELITEMQQFDPRGTQIQKRAQLITSLQQEQAQMVAAVRKAAEDNIDRTLARDLKIADLQGKTLANDAARRKAMGGTGGGVAGKTEEIYPVERYKALGYPKEVLALITPGMKHADVQKLLGEWGNVSRVNAEQAKELDRKITEQQSKQLFIDGRPILKKSGEPLELGKEVAQEALEYRQGLRQFQTAIGRLKELGIDGVTGKLSPDERAEVTQITGQVRIAMAKMLKQSLGDKQSQGEVDKALWGTDNLNEVIGGDIVKNGSKAYETYLNLYYQTLKDKGFDGNPEEVLAGLRLPTPKVPTAAEESFARALDGPTRPVNVGDIFLRGADNGTSEYLVPNLDPQAAGRFQREITKFNDPKTSLDNRRKILETLQQSIQTAKNQETKAYLYRLQQELQSRLPVNAKSKDDK